MRAFIRQIDAVEASNFPHPDGKEALNYIREYSDRQLARLEMGIDADADLVDGLCKQGTLAVQRFTKILGFILRSTNVRNPFELHFPLRSFLSKVIGPEARLLLSSEWEFIPFTYPMNISLLPAFALVGLPASESDNVLVTPLAGHEIGHSVWLSYDLKGEFEEALAFAIDETMSSLATETDRLIEGLRMGELGRQSVRQTCLHYGLLQLEEIFCDTVGLYSFGASFLYAFEYFLAPGGNIRSLEYPSDVDRIGYIRHAADQLGLEYDPTAFAGWTQSADNQHVQRELVVLLDAAVAKVATSVIARSAALLAEKGITVPRTEAIARISAAFARTEPDCDGGSLAEVVTAGWLFVRDRGGLASDSETNQFRMLSDLMLKSVEVAEFFERVTDDA